jgi:hypothetical protein
MKSPFPGMDPYLERHWGDVHTSLVVYMRDQINERLPPDLQARVEEDLIVDLEEQSRLIYPDVRIVEESPPGLTAVAAASGVAVAEPCLVPVVDELPTPRHIEIVEPGNANRVVTALELLSPANKIGEAGREAYCEKQSHYIEAGVNLVEIDLIRQGAFVLAVPESQLPLDLPRPYTICVRRATRRLVAEVIGISLRERLPNIAIPLRPSDRDVPLELQPLVDECYRRGRYGSIDYSQPLRPNVDQADREWIGTLLANRA